VSGVKLVDFIKKLEGNEELSELNKEVKQYAKQF